VFKIYNRETAELLVNGYLVAVAVNGTHVESNTKSQRKLKAYQNSREE